MEQVNEGRMSRILRLDKQQASAAGIVCPINPDHGRMGVHVGSEMLLCTYPVTRTGTIKLCNGHTQLSASE